jgi:Tol biopolymer transport system component/C-terminal processing protease CtpA/Prc
MVLCLGGAGFALGQSGAGADRPPAYAFSEPGISPDGREIAFASGGDIWSVPAAGGDAHLLVAHAASDRRPLYSPDGRTLAFVSDRTGGGDIYLLSFATGALRRLTWDDGLEEPSGWSRDGRWIYFHSTGRDIAGMNDVYRVPATGGTPMPVSGDRYTSEFAAAPAPDGRHVALVARGISASQWWRRGSSHIDQSELWMLDLEATDASAYSAIAGRDARQSWPMWSGDGRTLWYVSDAGGTENIWRLAPGDRRAEPKRVTSFSTGRLLWPSISADGRSIAFERDFGIWTMDTASGAATSIPIVRRGAVSAPTPERVRQTSQFSDLALSPDGRKIAFVAHGDVFAAPAKDGGDATRVTATNDLESQPVWSPDSRTLAYVSGRGEGQQIYLYDFGTNAETALTSGDAQDISPVFSPDGKEIAFLRNRRELRVITLAGRAERVAGTGSFGDAIDTPEPVWSPDGRWLAAFVLGTKGFTNVELVPAAGGPRRPVSFLANAFANTIAWSRDGTYLLFDTRQRTEPGQLARVDLTLRTPKFREDLFRDLFTSPTQNPKPPADPKPVEPKPPADPAADRAPAPAEPIFEGIRQRLSIVPIGLDVNEAVISPDGKTAVVSATTGGQTNLYAWSLDDLAATRPVARQLTTSTGGKSDPQFTPDSKEVYFLEGGRVQIASIERREARPLAVTAEMTIDFGVEKLQVFRQAWTLLRDHFFDDKFNGVDWRESRLIHEPRAAAAATPDDLRRVISLMIGDLNASHLGISGGGGGAPAIGRLGLTFDRREYEANGRLRVTSVVPLGPAALTRAVQPGEYVTAINGVAIGAGVNLDELLADTTNRRVEVSVAAQPGAAARIVPMRPVSQATEKGLLYRAWVEGNREYVLKKSGGRLGYVHMINMSAGALDQLHIDLDTANHSADGVVIDLRNNSGGFVNAYALDVFARQPYLSMTTRGLPESPARAVLGQRALERRTVLVVNQHSLSDAEDFTEGYRTLKLGTVVGEPTAGWIIYTWNRPLVDGSTLRLPRVRIKGADGTDMEMHPRQVDVPATRALGESLVGQDSQLDEAIRTLLSQLGRAESPLPGGRR